MVTQLWDMAQRSAGDDAANAAERSPILQEHFFDMLIWPSSSEGGIVRHSAQQYVAVGPPTPGTWTSASAEMDRLEGLMKRMDDSGHKPGDVASGLRKAATELLNEVLLREVVRVTQRHRVRQAGPEHEQTQ